MLEGNLKEVSINYKCFNNSENKEKWIKFCLKVNQQSNSLFIAVNGFKSS